MARLATLDAADQHELASEEIDKMDFATDAEMTKTYYETRYTDSAIHAALLQKFRAAPEDFTPVGLRADPHAPPPPLKLSAWSGKGPDQT